ncbi:NAD(P)-binding protein [Schizophyllum commune H4-8]|uniref:Uncharacterized protein n=1 Tax=Schizophyllum commune (strain H4-8 / FGSC 9210) TaxID=578458 RepID=D8PY44_SCHCM|nr:NAD(P)-binding protein [Schizophyllum commune H4-8]KAI5897171.1 NAD(P)-binding protein [Schizophyllum commune H4-8]
MTTTSSPRVWLITGANSGIGLALAKYALDQGDRVIATARDLKKIPASISAAKPIRLDLNASDEEIRQVAADALKIYGRIDILINNAGVGLPGTIEHVSDAALKENFQTNVFGPLSLTRALVPTFREQKSGAIASISSQGGLLSWPGFSSYCSTKVSLEFFMEGLGQELAPFGVKVLIIQPGLILTDWWTKAAAVQNKQANEVYPHIPGLEATLEWGIGTGCVSDITKAVQRMYEFVTGTGEAGAARKDEFIRLPLGKDCASIFKGRIEHLQKNLDEYLPITNSINLTEEQLAELKKARA